MSIRAAALLLAAAPALAGDAPMPADQAAMVAAERAFVQLAAERGFRDSFYRYFAPEGIAFGPHPFRTRTVLERQPSAPGPMGAVWAPVWGDISQAGDLGWNTGPLLFEARPAQNRPERHGMFFSVWKKQPDGSWLVVLDLGSDTPQPVVPLDTPYRTSWRAPAGKPARVGVAAATAELLAAERDLLADMKSRGIGQAYSTRLADDARVHRPGVMPVAGRAALDGWLADQPQTQGGTPLAAEVARSGDLGYAYGSYETGGEQPAAGYYARVWKRDAGGRWRIVMDTVSPLPPGVAPLPPALLDAEERFLAEDWAGAAAAYRSYVAQHPDNAFAWHRLGASQIGLRQLPEAIASLKQSVAVGGGTPSDFYNLACAYALSGDPEQALGYVEKAIGAGLRNRRQYESDGDLASLRELQRFQEMMQRL
jgi:ketosteroid isomerase-like protein